MPFDYLSEWRDLPRSRPLEELDGWLWDVHTIEFHHVIPWQIIPRYFKEVDIMKLKLLKEFVFEKREEGVVRNLDSMNKHIIDLI